MRRLIRADGTSEDLATPRTIGNLHAMIGASTVDTVTLRHLGHPLQVMILDDAGHAKRLPVNAEATKLYLANCKPNTTHTIRGDVVVVPDDDFGE